MFSLAAMQKAVAFVVLILLLVFFSIFAQTLRPGTTWSTSCRLTAVNGVLGVAVTFVIIAGGIDLAVGHHDDALAVVAGLIL